MSQKGTQGIDSDSFKQNSHCHEAVQKGYEKPEVGVDHVTEVESRRKKFFRSQPVLRRVQLLVYSFMEHWGFKMGVWRGWWVWKKIPHVVEECVDSGGKGDGMETVGSDFSNKQPVVAVIIAGLVIKDKQVMMLKRALQFISQQTRKADCIFVTDDGSPTPIRSRLSVEDQKGVTFLRLDKNSGPAAARNEGLKAARDACADIVCFTDADCLPQPRWIESFLSCFQHNPAAGILSGATRAFDPTESSLGFFYEFSGPWNGRVAPDGSLLFGATCNMAVRLKVVTLNFSTYFREAAYEDVEFCLRARKQGVLILKCKYSEVLHDCLRGGFGLFRQMYRYGRYFHHIANLHPDFTEQRRLSAYYCL